MNAAAALELLRPFTWLAPVVGVGSAAGVAAAVEDLPWATREVGLACLAAALATGASNAWNQVFDVAVDRVNRPDRPLPSGALRPGAALALGDLLAVAALLLGALVTPAYVACVAFGLLATWAYSAPPLRLKRRTVPALVAIAVPRGLLVPVAGWAAVASLDRPDPWALGGVALLFVLGAAATKDFADVAGDRAEGCRTLPVVLGPSRAARVVAPFLAAPFLLYPVLGWAGGLSAPLAHLVALGAALALLGVATGRWLVVEVRAAREPGTRRGAWVGMYLLLLGSQAGVLCAYAL